MSTRRLTVFSLGFLAQPGNLFWILGPTFRAKSKVLGHGLLATSLRRKLPRHAVLRRFTPSYAVLRRFTPKKKFYSMRSVQRDQRVEKHIRPVFWKVAKKRQNFNIKSQFESPKHLHQTNFETWNAYNKPCHKAIYWGDKVKTIAQAKSSPKCSAFFGPLHLFKSLKWASRSSLIAKKNHSIWSPWVRWRGQTSPLTSRNRISVQFRSINSGKGRFPSLAETFNNLEKHPSLLCNGSHSFVIILVQLTVSHT